MASTPMRRKHGQLNEAKLKRVKSILGAATKAQALERAMDFVLAEAQILKTLRRLKGKGRTRGLFAP